MAQDAYLVSPGCAEGCSECLLSCATARIRAKVWGDYLQKALRDSPTTAQGKAKRAEAIAEAQAALAYIAPSIRYPRAERRRAKLRLIRGGRA